MRRNTTKRAGTLGWLIAPALLIATLIFPPSMAEGQSVQRRGAQRRTLEGVVIRNNVATLLPGYEFVKESENVLSVKRKKKKKKKPVITGTLTCGCLASEGSCHISMTSENSAQCNGSCANAGCNMLVTASPTPKPVEPIAP